MTRGCDGEQDNLLGHASPATTTSSIDARVPTQDAAGQSFQQGHTTMRISKLVPELET